MHQRTEEVLAYMETERAGLERALGGIPTGSRATRPAPERWSAAEVLEHLSLVEAGIAKRIGDAIESARAAGLGPETSTEPILPTFDVARVRVRTPTLVAGEAIQPHSGVEFAAAAAALKEQREKLRAALVAADGLALGGVIIPHAAFGELNVYQWVVFASAHEGRHSGQIEEIAEHFNHAGGQDPRLASSLEPDVEA